MCIRQRCRLKGQAEILAQLFLKAQSVGEVAGFEVKKGGTRLPLLQYADDTIVFTKGNQSEANKVKQLLVLFEAVLGLKINSKKTRIFRVNWVEDWNEILKLWGCNSGEFPTIYLGLPLGARSKCLKIWDPLLERLRSKLAMWKRLYLSKGGRVILIKSTLTSIPVFMMSSRLMSAAVNLEIERLVRRFLWGTTEGKKKFHLVPWELVCLPLNLGGLGIKRLSEFNVALLCKWFWRSFENNLWIQVVREKYGDSKTSIFPNFSKGVVGCSIWKGLSRVFDLFRRITRFKPSSCSSLKFWFDIWCTDKPLASVFPRLFSRCTNKLGAVAEFYKPCSDGSMDWDLFLPRRLPDTEIFEVAGLLNLLGKVNWAYQDTLIWNDNSNDHFSVRNCFNKIFEFRTRFFNHLAAPLQWKKVWSVNAPMKINFFSWILLHGRILTQSNLKRRGFQLAERCPLCLSHTESFQHLFFNCPMAKELWAVFLSQSARIESEIVLRNVSSRMLSSAGRVIWKVVARAILWVIWEERNSRIFDETFCKTEKLCVKVKELAGGGL